MILRGRDFTEYDLELIKDTISQKLTLSRRELSMLICEKLNWRQPNGKLKDRACRDVLLHLNNKGIIQLPEPRYKLEKQNINIKPVDFIEPLQELNSEIKNFDLKTLRLELVTSLPQREI
jgi:hypothetical protein